MGLGFRYAARTSAGKLERGVLNVADREEALARLYERSLTPISLDAANSDASGDALSLRAARDLARVLAQLLRAGLPLAQALQFAVDELDGPAVRAAHRLRESAEHGEPLSDALRTLEGAPARLLSGVMRAGETSGHLAEALEVASQAFARMHDLRARVATAMIYPSFVILATLATLACFLFLVVPALAGAFSGAEDRLPASTRNLLALSAWVSQNGYWVVLVIILFGLAFAASAHLRRLASAALDHVLNLPLALGIAPRLDFSAFASLAALSVRAGVPTAAAFEAAAAGVGSALLRDRLLRTVASIRGGAAPSEALGLYAHPPRSFARLVVVGEQTGRLADALAQAAALLSSEAEQRLARLGAIAGPIVTLGLGVMVAGVIMSLFVGLLSLSDMAAAP